MYSGADKQVSKSLFKNEMLLKNKLIKNAISSYKINSNFVISFIVEILDESKIWLLFKEKGQVNYKSGIMFEKELLSKKLTITFFEIYTYNGQHNVQVRKRKEMLISRKYDKEKDTVVCNLSLKFRDKIILLDDENCYDTDKMSFFKGTPEIENFESIDLAVSGDFSKISCLQVKTDKEEDKRSNCSLF